VKLTVDRMDSVIRALNFLGLTVIGSPFVVWIGSFMHAFVFADEICKNSFMRPCTSLKRKTLFGVDEQEELLQRYCDSPPKQVCMLVGCNDGGKTALMSQILSNRPNAVHVNFQSHAVTGVSSFAKVITEAFEIKYLKLRNLLTSALPFAGGELIVMKEKLSMRDMKDMLQVATSALERLKDGGGHKEHVPVIYFDGIGENLNQWQDKGQGQELLQVLLAWSVYITKERQLAHVIFGTTPSFVSHVVYSFRDIHNNVDFIEVGDLPLDKAKEYVCLRRRKLEARCPEGRARVLLSDHDTNLIHRIVGGRVNDINRVFMSLEAGIGANVQDVLRSMLRHQRDRILASFSINSGGSKDSAEEEGEDEEDDYLDPLRKQYSQLTDSDEPKAEQAWPPWTPLQLWETMEIMVSAKDHCVPYHFLRNTVFEGEEAPLRGLIEHDIIGCRVGRALEGNAGMRSDITSDSTYITPFSPLILNVFSDLVKDVRLTQMVEEIRSEAAEREKRAKLGQLANSLRTEAKLLSSEKKEALRSMDIWAKVKEHTSAEQRQQMAAHLVHLHELIVSKEQALIKQKAAFNEMRGQYQYDISPPSLNDETEHKKASKASSSS